MYLESSPYLVPFKFPCIDFSMMSMIYILSILSLLAVVTALQTSLQKYSSSLRMGVRDDFNVNLNSADTIQNAVGAQPPLGFWDPLGLLRNADQARFDRLRNVERKHGRICMLAILGHIVTTYGYRLPGDIAYGVPFASIKSGLAAFDGIPAAGGIQLFLFIGLMEIGYGVVKDTIEQSCVRTMESFGWKEDTQAWKAAIELNNGRAAQMGILALMVHEKLDNNPYIINDLLGYPVPFNQ